MDWTEDGTMKTTVNDISNNIYWRETRCQTELLKNGDGWTDGRAFFSPRSVVGDRPEEAAPLQQTNPFLSSTLRGLISASEFTTSWRNTNVYLLIIIIIIIIIIYI